MGLKFKTDKRALIPRPETEVLVEETLKLSVGKKIENILDIGTGSGNIAVSLAKFLTQVKITAVDISQGALELAKENAVFNQVDKQISFLKCDICSEEFWGGLERFDLIISNPPYIKSSDLPNLPLDVQFEPQIALDAGSDGLKFYRAIIRKAERLLNKSGLLALEIGLGQKEQLIEILNEKFEALKIIKDYNSIDRVIIARLV
jgi:release factor glutamine methyltransferase